jgi:hypothetical protein
MELPPEGDLVHAGLAFSPPLLTSTFEGQMLGQNCSQQRAPEVRDLDNLCAG